MLHKEGGVNEDVTHCIKAGWLKWRVASGNLCDQKVPLRVKGKFYMVSIRIALLYESECWPSKKENERKMEVAEMRMLRWSCGRILADRILNTRIRNALGVASIIDKLREGKIAVVWTCS